MKQCPEPVARRKRVPLLFPKNCGSSYETLRVSFEAPGSREGLHCSQCYWEASMDSQQPKESSKQPQAVSEWVDEEVGLWFNPK